MSSLTTTITPAHPGTRPFKLAAHTTSYWDTLRGVDRIACINPHKFRKLGRKTGWFPAGVLLEKWTEEIYPAITKIINDAGNYEKIFGKHNKEVSRPCWLYMVGDGEQWMTARPTIVAICSKTRIAQRTCDLLQNIACMRTWNLGFDYMYHKEKVVLVTGDGDPATVSNLSRNLCGLQVLASTYPASLDAQWKQTTIGGILKINREYYCLSVAHAFHLDASAAGEYGSDSASDSDHDSHDSDDISSASGPTSSVSVIACRPDVLKDIDLGLYFDSGPISTSTRALGGRTGRTPMTVDNVKAIGSGHVSLGTTPRLRSLLLCAELDWVLVWVGDSQFFRPNLVHTSSGTTICPQRVSTKPPHGKVLVAAGVSGVFESYCYGIIGGLSLPGSFRMVDVWTIESSCLAGDCGSWVIDPITGDIYGIVIATAPEAQESYMLPAYQVYDSIKSKLPQGTKVGFPTFNDTGSIGAARPPSAPSRIRAPSAEAPKQSSMDAVESQATIIPSSDESSSRILEWYSFDKRGEDWNVADRRSVCAFQTEIAYKCSLARENVLDQIRAMDNARREQIHRLAELRRHACEVDGVVQPVAISVEAIQTMRSREKHQEGEKMVEVLSFDVMLSTAFPADGVPRALKPLADGVSDIRQPLTDDKGYTTLEYPSLNRALSGEEEKGHISRGTQGKLEGYFAKRKLLGYDRHDDYEKNDIMSYIRPKAPAKSAPIPYSVSKLEPSFDDESKYHQNQGLPRRTLHPGMGDDIFKKHEEPDKLPGAAAMAQFMEALERLDF